MPARNTSRNVGVACFQTRIVTPLMGSSSISKREPGGGRRARASARDTAGQGFSRGADWDKAFPRSTVLVVERHTRFPSPLVGEGGRSDCNEDRPGEGWGRNHRLAIGTPHPPR